MVMTTRMNIRNTTHGEKESDTLWHDYFRYIQRIAMELEVILGVFTYQYDGNEDCYHLNVGDVLAVVMHLFVFPWPSYLVLQFSSHLSYSGHSTQYRRQNRFTSSLPRKQGLLKGESISIKIIHPARPLDPRPHQSEPAQT
jgi:hypothetical protein